MKKLIRRGMAAALLAVAAAGVAVVGGADVQAAQPEAQQQQQLRPANLSASQGSLNLTQLQLENISATATNAATGAPIVGVLIKFTTGGGRLLGLAYTDHMGIAAINASENIGPGTVQELVAGYTAHLIGDGVHTPVTAHGAITVGTDTV